MRAVVQRVRTAAVRVQDTEVARIGMGLLVLVGVGKEDDLADAKYLADKISNLRIFGDQQGKMNLSVKDLGGAVLVVSQFTLYGDCRKGRRPGFDSSAPPEIAEKLYLHLVKGLMDHGIAVQTGQFQAAMLVEIANDGPVTLLLDSKRLF